MSEPDRDRLFGFDAHLLDPTDEQVARMRHHVLAAMGEAGVEDVPASARGTGPSAGVQSPASAAPHEVIAVAEGVDLVEGVEPPAGAVRLGPSSPQPASIELIPDSDPATDGGRTPRRRWLVLAAAAALIVVVGVLAVAGRRGGGPTLDAARSQPTLRELAAIARAMPDQPVTADQFQYRHTVAGPEGGASLSEELWLRTDGSGRQRTASESLPFGSTGTSRPDADRVLADGTRRNFAGFTYDDLRALPGDSERLSGLLEQSSGLSRDNLAVEVAELLSWPATPPRARAAAIELLDSWGFKPAGEVTVHGHNGSAWSRTDGATMRVVVLDPTTAGPVAEYLLPAGSDPADLAAATEWDEYRSARVEGTPD